MRKNLPLIIVLLLASLLRLWNLNTNPPHLAVDEAALGYNAYSILNTARDEHGEILPIIFKSFGDWKPGLYIYATVPFVSLLGLTEWAVRLPSALAGIAAVWLLYKIMVLAFKNRTLSLFSALALALSPWHIHFSRGAWEANLSLTLTLAGVLFFLKAIEKKQTKDLILSAIFFALTLWAYQGAKLSVSIVVLSLVLTCARNLFVLKRYSLTKALVIGLVLALPVIISLFQGKAGRLEVYSIFSYPREEGFVGEILSQDGTNKSSLGYLLYHSEPLHFARSIIGRWGNHLSPRFLFFEGDWSNPRHGSPNMGMFLYADILLLILGIACLSRAKSSNFKNFLLLWLVLAPLPAALSRDSIHAVRSLNLVVPLSVVVGMGMYGLFNNLNARRNLGKALGIFVVGLYLLNYIYFLDQYWVHGPVKNSKVWQYGYKQVIEEIRKDPTEYKTVIFQQSYNQPYIYFLFYEKQDPKRHQAKASELYGKSSVADVGLVSRLGNIEFRDASKSDLGKKDVLIIYDPVHPPFPDIDSAHIGSDFQKIDLLNGDAAFKLLRFNKL